MRACGCAKVVIHGWDAGGSGKFLFVRTPKYSDGAPIYLHKGENSSDYLYFSNQTVPLFDETNFELSNFVAWSGWLIGSKISDNQNFYLATESSVSAPENISSAWRFYNTDKSVPAPRVRALCDGITLAPTKTPTAAPTSKTLRHAKGLKMTKSVPKTQTRVQDKDVTQAMAITQATPPPTPVPPTPVPPPPPHFYVSGSAVFLMNDKARAHFVESKSNFVQGLAEALGVSASTVNLISVRSVGLAGSIFEFRVATGTAANTRMVGDVLKSAVFPRLLAGGMVEHGLKVKSKDMKLSPPQLHGIKIRSQPALPTSALAAAAVVSLAILVGLGLWQSKEAVQVEVSPEEKTALVPEKTETQAHHKTEQEVAEAVWNQDS
jgi:hypothetical protein